MYNDLKEMEVPEPHTDTASHEEHAKTIGEERLVSTPDVQRAIHATDREIADVILGAGLMIDSRMGFAGNAVALGRDRTANLAQIEDTHRGSRVVVFLAAPNIHPEVTAMKRDGLLPPDFAEETVYTHGSIDTNESAGAQKTDTFFWKSLVEGLYDKEKGEWVDNPEYWRKKVEKVAREEGVDSDEIQSRLIAGHALLKKQALERVQTESQKYLDTQAVDEGEWWSQSTPVTDNDLVRVP